MSNNQNHIRTYSVPMWRILFSGLYFSKIIHSHLFNVEDQLVTHAFANGMILRAVGFRYKVITNNMIFHGACQLKVQNRSCSKLIKTHSSSPLTSGLRGTYCKYIIEKNDCNVFTSGTHGLAWWLWWEHSDIELRVPYPVLNCVWPLLTASAPQPQTERRRKLPRGF